MTIHTSATRKEARARAYVEEGGDGTIRVNSKKVDLLPELQRLRIMEPTYFAEDAANDLSFRIEAEGGGVMGQAEAARVCIARALVEYTGSEELEEAFMEYDRHMLVEDSRQTEPHKPSQSSKGPRHKRQKSYR